MMENKLNSESELTEAIKGIVDALLEHLTNNKDIRYPVLEQSRLTAIIQKHNYNGVLNHLGFIESRNRLREIHIKMAEDPFKASFLENNLSKGIALLNDTLSDNAPFTPIPENKEEIIMPTLEIESLRYRYNNDKETYITKK